MAIAQTERRRPKRTFTMDDKAFELLTQLAEDVDVSRSRLLERLVGLDHEAYEKLTQAAAGVEVSASEFLDRVVSLTTIRMNGLRTWPIRPGPTGVSSWSI